MPVLPTEVVEQLLRPDLSTKLSLLQDSLLHRSIRAKWVKRATSGNAAEAAAESLVPLPDHYPTLQPTVDSVNCGSRCSILPPEASLPRPRHAQRRHAAQPKSESTDRGSILLPLLLSFR